MAKYRLIGSMIHPNVGTRSKNKEQSDYGGINTLVLV
jgi:hypothetical protein